MSIQLDHSFLGTSKSNWLAKVEKDLKGKPMAGLDWQYGPINGTPFYHRDDVVPLVPIPKAQVEGGWEIGFPIEVGDDVNQANNIAMEVLQQGATNLLFYLPNSFKAEAVATLLKGIQMEWVITQLVVPLADLSTITYATNQYVDDHFDAQQVKVYFRCEQVMQLLSWLAYRPDEYFQEKILFSIHASKKVNDPVSQVAHLMYKWNQVLEKVDDAKGDWATALARTRLVVRFGDHYLSNIALLRALQILSRLLLEGWGIKDVSPVAVEVQLTTGSYVEDIHYNKIKATAQALAAIIGGCNTLFIWPSDALQKQNGSIDSRRVSLNIQHILKMESYLKQISDPAAGSYFLESLTDQIAEKAWVTFQKMIAQR